MERPDDLHAVSDVLRRIYQFPSVTASSVAAGSLETTCRLKIESVERFSGDINKVRDELDDAGAGQEVFLVCQTEAEVRRLGEVFASTRVAQQGRLHFPLGSLQSGFRLVPEGDCPAQQRRVVSAERLAASAAAAAGPGDRQLPRPARRRPGGPRRPRHRPISRAEAVGEERAGRGAPRTGVSRADEALRAGVEDRAGAEIHRREQEPADVGPLGRPLLGTPEGQGPRGGRRPGGRHDRVAGRAGVPAGHQLPRGHRMAAPVRRLVSLSGDRRPVGGDGGDPRRHGPIAAHGPAPLRRRRLREDGSGDAGGVQGGRRRLPGGRARADDDPLRAAPPHVHRAAGGISFRDRVALAVLDPRRAGPDHPAPRRGLDRRRHRHASAGPAGRAVPQSRAGDHRRGAAVRRRGEGAAEGVPPHRRRADDDGDADPADAAHEPDGPARHLEPGNAAGGPAGRGNPRRAVPRRIDPPRGACGN